jgi:hypothetical protein
MPFDDRLDQEMAVGVGNECHRVSKPLNVLFFGANLFLGEWRFDRSLERQRVKAFHVRHHTLAGDGTIDYSLWARRDSPNPGSAIHRSRYGSLDCTSYPGNLGLTIDSSALFEGEDNTI